MGFLDETADLLNVGNSFFMYVNGTSGLVIEGYKKIYELSSTKITLLCEDNSKIEISGKDLSIKEISHREITILGKISSINFM